PVAERRQTERLVRPGVLFVADANKTSLEQLDDGREDFLTRQSRFGQIGGRARTNERQNGRELLQAVELVPVAMGAPGRVVSVLFAAARVAPGRLHVPLGVGTNPDIFPSRRYRQRANPLEVVRAAHGAAVRTCVPEAERTHLSRDARAIVA